MEYLQGMVVSWVGHILPYKECLGCPNVIGTASIVNCNLQSNMWKGLEVQVRLQWLQALDIK